MLIKLKVNSIIEKKKIKSTKTFVNFLHIKGLFTVVLQLYVEDRIFNRVVSIISVVRRETTFTALDSIETVSPVESEIVRVAFLSISELTEITRFKKKLMDTLVSLSW